MRPSKKQQKQTKNQTNCYHWGGRGGGGDAFTNLNVPSENRGGIRSHIIAPPPPPPPLQLLDSPLNDIILFYCFHNLIF